MPKKKLAIFDMDGTLVDTKDVNFYAYKEALEEEGFSLSYEYYCKFCNGRHYTVFLPPLVGEDRELLTRIHNKKKAAYSKYLEKAKSNLHLISLIRIMKQEYYCALVTTASRKNCEELLNTFGLMEQAVIACITTNHNHYVMVVELTLNLLCQYAELTCYRICNLARLLKVL